jgi:hypothetical protein
VNAPTFFGVQGLSLAELFLTKDLANFFLFSKSKKKKVFFFFLGARSVFSAKKKKKRGKKKNKQFKGDLYFHTR